MGIINKVKWVLGIFMVFFLIVGTNLIDRNNFIRMKDAVVTIYEDRLVAQDLLFDFYTLIQEKELAAVAADTAFFQKRNPVLNQELEELIARYLATKLTDREALVFKDFQAQLGGMWNLENTGRLPASDNRDYRDRLVSIQKNLHELSDIQLEEGRLQKLISKEAIETVELFTRLEIYLLIFLAVLVQIIVIYKPKSA